MNIYDSTLDNFYIKDNIMNQVESLEISEDALQDSGDNDRLFFKKILKKCHQADIEIRRCIFKLLPHLIALCHLSFNINREYGLASLGGMFRNFLNLVTLRIETIRCKDHLKPKKSKIGFFATLHKLPRLERVKLVIYSEDLENVELNPDFNKFYSKPHNFRLSIKIKLQNWPGIEANWYRGVDNTNLKKILSATDYLSVWDCGKDPNKDPDLLTTCIKKEEKKRMKLGKKNIVKIFNYNDKYSFESDAKINVVQILSYCDALEHLYIREGRLLIQWRCLNQQEINALRNLKMIALEFNHLCVSNNYQLLENTRDDEIEMVNNENQERWSEYASSLFAIFSQIKQKCHSLQDLSLYLTDDFSWVYTYAQNKSLFRQNFIQFIQEISSFDKLKTFELLINPDDFPPFPLKRILSNNSIESFQLRFHSGKKDSVLKWDSYFAAENKSQIKELKITAPLRVKITPFGINLLNDIRSLSNLQVVELIDENLEPITFDFFYEFFSSLLEKKGIRKILICTNVTKTDNSENMLNQMSQKFEKKMKDLQLEEILIGRLKGYSFEYLFYNKEMGIVNKLFWTEEEMNQLLREKRELAVKYSELLYLFRGFK